MLEYKLFIIDKDLVGFFFYIFCEKGLVEWQGFI